MVKSISNQGLLSERDTPVLVITLRHSEKRNTLSLEKLVALSAEIESFANDTTLRVLVIKAEGPVFRAGHDLHEINNGTSFQYNGADYDIDYIDVYDDGHLTINNKTVNVNLGVLVRGGGTLTLENGAILNVPDLSIFNDGTLIEILDN